MPKAATTKGHCPNCGPNRTAPVRGQHRKVSSEDVDGGRYTVKFSETYSILQCAGCEEIYCERVLWCSEWGDPHDPGYETTYWPSTVSRKPPFWIDGAIDDDMRRILVEVYGALNNEMPILAAIGIRTAFDRATELLGIDRNASFNLKLDRLVQDGRLSSNDRKALAALVDAGSAAAHRGWRPDDAALTTMITILESFLQKEFVNKACLDSLVLSIPSRRA